MIRTTKLNFSDIVAYLKGLFKLACGGGQVVRVIAFYYSDLGSNPAEMNGKRPGPIH